MATKRNYPMKRKVPTENEVLKAADEVRAMAAKMRAKRLERFHLKAYIVQTPHSVVGFNYLDLARNHARLNGGGRIWRSADVRDVQDTFVTVPKNAQPLEEVW